VRLAVASQQVGFGEAVTAVLISWDDSERPAGPR
jgi:hypothetical protein